IETVDTGCTVEGDILRCVQTGTGTASHLGRFTLDWVIEINLTTLTATGTYVFKAANGDELRTTFTAEGFPTDDPTIRHIVEEHTIVGGTGRFAVASGSFVHDALANEALALPVTVGILEGTISY